jgi:hypothetical protein
MLQKRWVRWGLVEVAVVAGIVSCGEVSESPDAGDADEADDADVDAGTGGQSTGGATSSGGALTSGGATSAGGSIFIGSGGRIQAQGGATSDWCPGIPAGVVVPPCTEDDVIVEGGCNFDSWFSFEFPIADLGLSYPTAELNLWLTAPADPELGQGGAPSVLRSEPLNPWFNPQQNGTVTDTGFVISEAGTQVYSQVAPELASMAEYFTTIEGAESNQVYYITHVALTDGDRRLSERRVVFEPTQVCLIK